MSLVPRWIRIALLTLVALGVVTIVAALLDGTGAYVASAIGVFVVVALGTPLALRPSPPSEAATEHTALVP